MVEPHDERAAPSSDGGHIRVLVTQQEVLQPVTAPLEVDPAAKAPPEALLEGLGKKIEGRSLGQIAWMRLRRDRHPMGLDVKLLLVGCAGSRQWPRRWGWAF